MIGIKSTALQADIARCDAGISAPASAARQGTPPESKPLARQRGNRLSPGTPGTIRGVSDHRRTRSARELLYQKAHREVDPQPADLVATQVVKNRIRHTDGSARRLIPANSPGSRYALAVAVRGLVG